MSHVNAAAPRSWRGRALDAALWLGLFGGYLAWLLATTSDLGYSRDEGFYFHAARTYGKWFEILLENPTRALTPGTVDRYWRENSEHPALMKSLFWLSQRWLEGPVFHERGTAYRFPGMLLSALAVAVTFAWGRRSIGRAGGVVAASCFALMPRVFYHSHLACFDMPIVALWLLTAYAYYRSLERGRWGWALACGAIYGLALNTKHNAWLLPFALVAHVLVRHLLVHGLRFRGEQRLRVPLALPAMALLGPAILYGSWPWIWRDTVDRLTAYVKFHLEHVYYNMEFLGSTWFEPPFPRSYAWLMTLGTVPAITLVLFGLGLVVALRAEWARARARRQPAGGGPITGVDEAASSALWLLCILLSYAPWLSTSTPIFGGTKHWLNAYPFMALFAGQGFAWIWRVLHERLPRPHWRMGGQAAAAACVVAGPWLMTAQSHPWGLSAYTPLVGGAPGAASLGLNRTFWGYTTGAVQDFINAAAPNRARVFVHDTAMGSFRMLQRDRRLRRDLKPWWTVARSRLALYHHEQHMSRVEHMIWVDYDTTSPSHVGTHDGVPVVWVYERGRRRASEPAR